MMRRWSKTLVQVSPMYNKILSIEGKMQCNYYLWWLIRKRPLNVTRATVGKAYHVDKKERRHLLPTVVKVTSKLTQPAYALCQSNGEVIIIIIPKSKYVNTFSNSRRESGGSVKRSETECIQANVGSTWHGVRVSSSVHDLRHCIIIYE